MIKNVVLFCAIILTIYSQTVAQDSIRITEYKNTIRWNITPIAIVGPKSIVLGYERTIKPYQSFSINLGYLEIAPFTNDDGEEIHFFDQQSKGGLDISGDYRFYFQKENKYKAPHGLYWGPYMSYYGLWQDASLNLIDNGTIVNTISYQGSFNMYSIGVQIGYQFVIKNRFTIDLIMIGPSYTYYDLNMKLHFNQDIDTDDPFYQDLYNIIKDSSPILANFLKDQSFEANGRLKFSYYGFRYGIQIGYRF